MNRFREQFSAPAQAGGGFNPYAAGKKHYGAGRPMPTVGRVQDKRGYGVRDGKAAARKEALMRREYGSQGNRLAPQRDEMSMRNNLEDEKKRARQEALMRRASGGYAPKYKGGM